MVRIALEFTIFCLTFAAVYKLCYFLSAQRGNQRDEAVQRLVEAAAKAVPFVGHTSYEDGVKVELKRAIEEVTGESWANSYRERSTQ